MKLLIVEDEYVARYGMAKALSADGRTILEAEDGNAAVALIRDQAPDLVFLDLNMPICDGLSVLKELRTMKLLSPPEIIVVTANDTVETAVDCIRCGASDFLSKPYDVDHLRAIVRRSEERVALQHRVSQLQLQLADESGLGQLRGISRPMSRLFSQIARAAKSALPVLIRGESGTGKELVARELHARSDRAHGCFIAVNTAAIAETLIESELFGHIKGAFTGADRTREGVFRQADGGTLFLDEIGDMPLGVQTRLLRVLQENVVQPVGSEVLIAVNVRVISATHQNLEEAITGKIFRQDLYYRLRGIELTLPPLRSRQEDILLLANEFLAGVRTFSSDAVQCLLQHTWPGNVRELKQRVQSAVAMSESERILPGDLGLTIQKNLESANNFERYLDLPLTDARNQLMDDFDRAAIERALNLENGNVSAAARLLGIHRQSLQQKMRSLGIRQ
ncbi:MAG: sigma-54 dependent transcriptional regulator [Planctomycetota bacterium]|nr:sigma-54 dependent transcriptional regulator [Planctomycetota bacterium]